MFGKLFVAGILPGILLSIFFAVTVATLCRRNPAIGPPGAPTSGKEKLRALRGIIIDCGHRHTRHFPPDRHVFAESYHLLVDHFFIAQPLLFDLTCIEAYVDLTAHNGQTPFLLFGDTVA